MREVVQTTVTLPEIIVRNPSRYRTNLHRINEDDDVRPACPDGDYREDVDWATFRRTAYEGHFGFCDNPECFGRDWR